MKKLSKVSNKLIGQPMFKVLAKVNELEKIGCKIVHFEIGDPDFSTPENVIEAAKKALSNGKTHYANSMGIAELREAICWTVKKDLGFKPTMDQVLVVPANAIIDFAIRCIVSPGEEVIVPDPGFPTYYAVMNYCGVKMVRVPVREKNNFCIDPIEIEKRITSKTKLIIINSPQNPTGSVMSKSQIKKVSEIAEKHKIYLLSDEVYSKIIYDNHHYSPAVYDKCQKRTITINSFSKVYAMTGWRLGYAVGPKEVIHKMGLMLQTIISCLPPFIQWAGIDALLGDQEIVSKRIEILKERRDAIVSGLNSIPGVTCKTPGGAFYAFANVTGTNMSDEEFTDFMLKKAGVAVLPGNNFGNYGRGYVRLCYAVASEDISEGIKRMRNALIDHRENL